jgi:hypothetical protein
LYNPPMTKQALTQALEDVYTSLHSGNAEIDARIAALKSALTAAGEKVAMIDAERLVQNNRDGRKRLQAYFRQRGVAVEFNKA